MSGKTEVKKIDEGISSNSAEHTDEKQNLIHIMQKTQNLRDKQKNDFKKGTTQIIKGNEPVNEKHEQVIEKKHVKPQRLKRIRSEYVVPRNGLSGRAYTALAGSPMTLIKLASLLGVKKGEEMRKLRKILRELKRRKVVRYKYDDLKSNELTFYVKEVGKKEKPYYGVD